jgi:hypothetical protein
MSYVVLGLLSLLWLGLFLPGLLQARRSSPFVSATTFQQSLTRISTGMAALRPEGQRAAAQSPRTRTRRRPSRRVARRRDTLMALSAAVIGAAAVGISFGGLFLLLIVPPLLALTGYVVMLRIQVARRSAMVRAAAPAYAETVAPPPVATPDQDGIVPSVRRRVPAMVPDDDVELERLAG